MTVEDIIDFANANQIQLTISVDPDPLTFIVRMKKNSKRIFQGWTLDVLQEPWDIYIREELVNMLCELEESECHTS